MVKNQGEVKAGSSALPLSGVKVLDLGTFIAGPFAATTLAEFGAEVVKVELPGVGDPCRRFGSSSGEENMTLPWLSEARNKKSITLDLRDPEGAELLKKLVADVDIVCENFQAQTLEKWGLGYDVLSEINPGLIMVRISAYGQTGPYNDRPGFGRIANAFSGLSYLAGEPDRIPVTPGSATLADYGSGIYGALGALIALRERDQTGLGQVVDIGLYESIFRLLDELVPAYARHGFVRERMGAATVNVAPHSHYPTADNKWIAIACTTDKIFERMTRVMEAPELATDPRFELQKNRVVNIAEIDQIVSDWTSSLSAEEAIRLCAAGSVPCGLLNSVEDLFNDPQVAARDNIVSMTDKTVGEVFVPGVVPRLSRTPGRINSLGPRLGEHTEEILSEKLKMTIDQIEALKSRHVI